MTSIDEARDQLIGAFRTAWLASTAAAVPLEYDDVRADTSSAPSAPTRRAPFVRLTVRHFAGVQETLGRDDARRFLNTCAFVAQISTEPGDGRKKADELAKVALRILRRMRNPNGVWGTGDATPTELGIDEHGMQQTNVTATFNYQEVA